MTTGDRAIRWAAAAAVMVVAAIAVVISYGHAYELVRTHGESGATARALPLTIDGLIATCSLVLLDAARQRRPAPVMARLLLWLGIVATLCANVAHGAAHGWVGMAVATWPAVVATGSFEVLAKMIRGTRVPAAHTNIEPDLNMVETPAPDEPDPVASTAPGPPNSGLEVANRLGGLAAPEIGTASAEISQPLADLAAPETRTSGTDLAAPEIANGLGDPVVATARDRFAEQLANGTVPSVRTIRSEMRVGHPKAKRIRAALAEEST